MDPTCVDDTDLESCCVPDVIAGDADIGGVGNGLDGCMIPSQSPSGHKVQYPCESTAQQFS